MNQASRWLSVAYLAALIVAVALLSWSTYESWTHRHSFVHLTEAKARAIADALAQAVESSLELDGDTRSRAGSLLQAAVEKTGFAFATLLDSDGHVLESAVSSADYSDGTLTLYRKVQIAPGRIGRLHVGIPGAEVFAEHRSSQRRSFLVSLVSAGLAAIMSAAVFLRYGMFLRQVRRERSFTEAVLAGMSDAVVVYDREDVIRMVNPAACTLFGAPPAAFMGRRCDANPCQAIYRELMATGRALESMITRSEGAPTAVLATLSRVHDSERQVTGKVLILRDLTEFNNLRREERQSRNLAAFARFASMVAHEVRNPLNAIALGVQRLELEGIHSAAEANSSRLLELIQSEVYRLDRIVTDFLDLAHPQQLKPGPSDLDTLLEGMLPLLREGAPSGVEITLRCGNTKPAIFDPMAMRQIALNLVRNAREAVGAQGRIDIVTRQENGTVVLEVEDDGPGIPLADLDQVFEFGFTTKPQGNGVGLYTVHLLVTEMRGSVGVEPNDGRGARIRVALQAAELATLPV